MTQTLTFYCQTITPMFLHGADGKTPELRAPSIKGGLRFWWRALHGHLDLSQLKEEEALIFGASNQGIGRSSFSIRVSNSFPHQSDIINIAPLPHRPPPSFKAKAIRIGYKFRIGFTIEAHKHPHFNLHALENLFILLSILGGIGKRARRGFGSFMITHIQRNKNEVAHFDVPDPLAKIQETYQTITPHSLSLHKGLLQGKSVSSSVSFPYVKRIAIGKTIHSNLLEVIGRQTHDFLKNASSAWDYKDAMGHAESGRLASPVYVSALQSNRGLVPVITTLHAALKGRRSISKNAQQIQQDFQDKLL